MRTILIASVAMGLIAFAGISQAMPLAALAEASAEASLVATTSGGCGWFGHRGPAGYCRPIFTCPPGWHTGPFGQHCFRNW
jgi:hypothetical protein